MSRSAILLLVLSSSIGSGAGVEPPVAPRHPHVTVVHGDTLTDNYFWLRERDNPDVMEYLRAENTYADSVMEPLSVLQDSLYREILGHMKQTDVGAPYPDGGYVYYKRTEEGKQYPIYCRKRSSSESPEQVILNTNDLARGHAFFSFGSIAVSDDGTMLAYTTDTVGYRQYELQVKDLRTGALLGEQRERVDDIVWAADNRTLFCVTEDSVTKRQDKFFRHVLGSGRYDLVFEETDELFDLTAHRSRDRSTIFLQSVSKTSSEVRFLDATHPASSLQTILSRQPDHEYDADRCGDLFYIRTNKGALNFRLVTAPVSDPLEKNWKEIVAHRPSLKINAIAAFAHHLVLSEMEDGLDHIEVMDLEGRHPYRITYPEPVYTVSLAENMEFNTSVLRYAYQSLVTPASVIAFDMDTHASTIIKQTEVPGGFDRNNYVSERMFANASDGTRVPISIVYRKGIVRRPGPLFLFGYGSYGISFPARFSSSRLALLDRGVTFAIAHVRGGGELGEQWRIDGRMMKKMNTFTDFIACAEHLIAKGYTAPDRLVIGGGSAGGMLIGAVTNMRPDLFKAVIAYVPFVDIINTMLDASLPLTTGEYIEWGNPAEKPAFDYMIKYSPYDNVKRQPYPAMLTKVSMNDSQVPYWEGAKLVAKLRALKSDSHTLLLKVNFGAGHGGYSGRYDASRDQAFDYAFALHQMGVK